MSVLKSQFNPELDQNSPVVDEYNRVVKYDEDGNEVVLYEKTDLPAHTKSLGIAEDWSLNSLVKAGINPAFNIHTTAPSRIDNAGAVKGIEQDVDKFLETSKPLE